MWLRSNILWLWRRPAAAAPIRSLAWELPYGMGTALKKKKKKKKKEREKKKKKKKKKKRIKRKEKSYIEKGKNKKIL